MAFRLAGKEALMSRQPYGMTTPEQRDQAADDSDEAAWQRDCASTARDRQAAERDQRWATLYARAESARRSAEALAGPARTPAPPWFRRPAAQRQPQAGQRMGTPAPSPQA
jgi:hypothetical protein